MRRRLRLFIALIVMLATIAFDQSPGTAGQSVWSEFSSKDGGFSLLMPNNPTQEVQKVDTDLGKMDCHLIVGQDGDRGVFIASYTDFPSVITEQNAIHRTLDGARNQLLANGQKKLLNETTITRDGYIGRELTIEAPDWNIVTRIYWVKRRLYQLIAMTPKDKPVPQDAIKFLASFKLISEVTARLQQSAWVEFSSEQGGFTVLMPSKPTQQTMPVESPAGPLNVYLNVSIGAEGIAYFACYSDMPSAPSDQSQTIRALDDVRNGQLKSAKGKLQSETTISLSGYPGRELKMETPTGLAIVRVYLVKQRLYQVLAVIPESAANTEAATKDTARFLSSFKFIPR